MKLGIMQPYFFPYIGYFSLIAETDKWVVFDSVQFIRHGWIERNRILKPGDGWQYISVPLIKHSRDTKISELRIRTNEDWKEKIIRQLDHYRKRAPYFRETMSLVEQCFATETDRLVDLNVRCLDLVCRHLQIPFDYTVFSSAGLEIGPVDHPGQWASEISSSLGATQYFNPPGGAEIFPANEFEEAGVTLKLLENNLPPYSQHRADFIPGLSIIDVMMFNDRETVRLMTGDVSVTTASVTTTG